MKKALFNLGATVATPGALDFVSDNPPLLAQWLKRHVSGDWGDLDDDDKRSNDYALYNQGRLLSVYSTDKGRVYVITEWDRSVTTILLPEEY